MMQEIGVIGSGAIGELFRSEEEIVETSYGKVVVNTKILGNKKVIYLNRHQGVEQDLAPHNINFNGNIFALHELGVKRIIGISSVGVINKEIKLNKLMVANDFFDLTKTVYTFHDERIHVDMTKPYCPELNDIILKVGEEIDLEMCEGGYICTQGPRLETPLEIKVFSKLGCDVVGMTSVPEAILCRELEMCYASIAIPTNYAAGLQKELSAEEIRSMMKERIGDMKNLLPRIIKEIPSKRNCVCKNALKYARL